MHYFDHSAVLKKAFEVDVPLIYHEALVMALRKLVFCGDRHNRKITAALYPEGWWGHVVFDEARDCYTADRVGMMYSLICAELVEDEIVVTVLDGKLLARNPANDNVTESISNSKHQPPARLPIGSTLNMEFCIKPEDNVRRLRTIEEPSFSVRYVTPPEAHNLANLGRQRHVPMLSGTINVDGLKAFMLEAAAASNGEDNDAEYDVYQWAIAHKSITECRVKDITTEFYRSVEEAKAEFRNRGYNAEEHELHRLDFTKTLISK